MQPASSPEAQQFVQLPSGPLRYHVRGTGRPLLYLHPAGGVRWTLPLEKFAERYQLFVPVMPGFDASPMHEGIDSMRGLAELAGQFVDRAIGEPCDVIGQSFGGWLACWLAVQRPPLVGQLVLECPAGFRPHGTSPAVLDAAALKRALYLHPEKLPADGKPIETEAANRGMLAHYHATLGTDEALLARLGEIEALTLIVHGSADRLVPASSVQLLRARIRRSYLVYIHDAAHNIEVDQPERFHALVDSFLARAEAFMVNWSGAALP